jgi:uncharacterized UBP type Zn finger protein
MTSERILGFPSCFRVRKGNICIKFTQNFISSSDYVNPTTANPHGLVNFGNMCFVNRVVQMLFAQMQCRDAVENHFASHSTAANVKNLQLFFSEELCRAKKYSVSC